MKILYILKHNPWGIGGGCYACRNYFDAFSDIFSNSSFDILYCSEFNSVISHQNTKWNFIPTQPMGIIKKLISPITGIINRFQSEALKLININNYDYCIFDHSSIAGSLSAACKTRNIKTIVINHNCEYDYYRDSHPQWYKQFFILPLVKRNEKKAFKSCDFNIFLTSEDLSQFQRIYGASNSNCIIGGCFEQKGNNPAISIQSDNIFKQSHKLKLILSGTLGNIQNMDGIDYFFNELYHLLPSNIDVIITGKNPPQSLIERIENGIQGYKKTTIKEIYDAEEYNSTHQKGKIQLKNVTLIPNPTNIQEIVASGDIYLCPTRLGGGQKLRIMDGLRNGLPVICHKVSARGYNSFVEKEICLTYTTPTEFIQCLNKAIYRIKNNILTKQTIKSFYLENMGYIQKINSLKNIITK